MKVAVVDTGGANLASITNAFRRLDCEVCLTTSSEAVEAATHIVLPGVGHAGYALERLTSLGLVDCLKRTSGNVLGICLGMQLLFETLEEGLVPGLGIFPGSVKRLKPAPGFRVPNIGWSQLRRAPGSPTSLLEGIEEDAYFYFTHSYACPEVEHTTASTRAPHSVSSVIEHKNFFGTQFHPEKSGTPGEKLLLNFLTARS